MISENRDNQQYWFTPDCTDRLANLVNQDSACLCVPSVALQANAICLDIDTRFSNHSKFVFYDLLRGLHSNHRKNTTKLAELEYKFDIVLCDPPFSFCLPVDIARNVNALLAWKNDVTAYICYPCSGFNALESAFLELGFVGQDSGVFLEYQNPPRGMGNGEKREIRLYQFERIL